MATTAPTDLVSVSHDGDVAELVLARADAHNAINRDWVDALAAATGYLAGGVLTEGGTGVRALLIRAEGPAFTVGGDLAHFSAHSDDLVPELEGMIATFHAALATLAELPMPVVCAAHGSVAGGGLGLLWASDVVLLAADTKLTTAFARLGLSGDGGSSWYLPRLVGERRALSLLLNATVLSAEDALEMGLADAVVPGGELLAHARERARRLAAGPTLALATMRRLVREAAGRSLAEGLDAELAATARLGASEDFRRGIAAFSSGERPEFQGA
jgi:2-(1,2-epoxy-1,2-dihydrophenyl)acetyl-CoA isomerase